jgi:hypothetical protein
VTVIADAEIAKILPHGLGRLLVLNAPRHCPCCHMSMLVWIDTGSAAACMGCLTSAALGMPRRMRPFEPRRTQEHT